MPRMLASDFDAYWRATYPEAVTLGHLLRTTIPTGGSDSTACLRDNASQSMPPTGANCYAAT
jgi:hypothetical protein